MKKKRVSRNNNYWIANNNENLKKLEAHKDDPYEVLCPMFDGRSQKTLKRVMYENKMKRDRDKAPNATKIPKKWTEERISELRECRNDSKSALQKRFSCSWQRIVNVMSDNSIRRDRPEEILWSDETDRILVQAALESHAHDSYASEGRKELNHIYAKTVSKLKEVGFGGSTAKNALFMHLKGLSQDRFEILGFTGIQTPLGWGMPAEKRQAKKPGEAKEETVTPKEWYLNLSPERKQAFDDQFLADYRNPYNTSAELLEKWPEAKTRRCLLNAADHFGETRNRAQIRQDNAKKMELDREQARLKRLEEAIKSIDEVAKKFGPLPQTDDTTPHIVLAPDNDESVKYIGSTFLGMVRPTSTYEQPLSNTLREAEARCKAGDGPDAVIITGDILYLDAKRFSNLKPRRATMEQIPIIPEVVTDQWVKEQIANGETIFLTFQEKFEMLLEVVRVFFAPNEKPIYSGKILVCLGKREEDLATYIANERANVEVAIIKARQTFELVQCRRDLKQALKDGDQTGIDQLQGQIEALERRLRERIKATSLTGQYLKELYNRGLAYIASRLESAIPNSKVISAGDGFVRIGKELNEIRQKGTESPKDTFEDHMIPEYNTRATAGENVPDITVGGGLNPVCTRGEIDTARGEFLNPDMSAPFIVTLPVCAPGEFLRDQIKQIHAVSTSEGLSKLVRSRDFTGGVFDMIWVSGFPMTRFWTDECLTNKELWSSPKAIKKLIEGQYMIYELVSGCEHRGQNWQAFINTDEGPIIFTEAVWNFLLKQNVPLHMIHFLGDKWTGHNFEGKSFQKPKEWLPPDQIRTLVKAIDLWPNPKAMELLNSGRGLHFIIRKIQKENPTTLREKYMFFRKVVMQNEILAGIDGIDLQRDSWKEEILPLEAELVARAIGRARQTGVVTCGNDIGLVVCETGNHVSNTGGKEIGKHYSEGHEVKIYLTDAVRMAHPELWEDGRLQREIISPVEGRLTKTDGLFGVVNPKRLPKMMDEDIEKELAYRLAAKHKGEMHGARHTDLIKIIRRADERRGRRRAFEGRYSISHFGHNHYCFSTYGRNRKLDAGGCHTFDDPYGESGNYRLTSVCVTIHGFPAKGPAWGPITEVHLRFAEFRRWLNKKWEVDIQRLFPNAL